MPLNVFEIRSRFHSSFIKIEIPIFCIGSLDVWFKYDWILIMEICDVEDGTLTVCIVHGAEKFAVGQHLLLAFTFLCREHTQAHICNSLCVGCFFLCVCRWSLGVQGYESGKECHWKMQLQGDAGGSKTHKHIHCCFMRLLQDFYCLRIY